MPPPPGGALGAALFATPAFTPGVQSATVGYHVELAGYGGDWDSHGLGAQAGSVPIHSSNVKRHSSFSSDRPVLLRENHENFDEPQGGFSSKTNRLVQEENEQAEEDELEDEANLEDMMEHVTKAGRQAQRQTERAGAVAEAVRLETVDEAVRQAATDAEVIMAQVPFTMRTANLSLRKIYEDRAALDELDKLEGKADPHMYRRLFQDGTKQINDTIETIAPALQSVAGAKTLQQTASRLATLSTPVIQENEVRLKQAEEKAEGEEVSKPSEEKPGEEELDAQEAILKVVKGEADGNGTSAGCQCDETVKCSYQGQSFNWCQVGGGRCPVLRPQFGTEEAGGKLNPNWIDAAGYDHHVYGNPGPFPASGSHHEQTGYVWDYCTPAPKRLPKGAAPKTAHGGLCAWKGDLYERYEKDSKYQSTDMSHPDHRVVDTEKVPFEDRLAIEAMVQYKASPGKGPGKHTLCDETPSSKPYAVCPAIPDPDNPEAGTNGWLASRTWDFCTDRDWTPDPRGEMGPRIPALEKPPEPIGEEARTEEGDAEELGEAEGPGGPGDVNYPLPTMEELAKKNFARASSDGQRCTANGHIKDAQTCKFAAGTLGLEWDKAGTYAQTENAPKGCYFFEDTENANFLSSPASIAFFNNVSGDPQGKKYTEICEVKAGPTQFFPLQIEVTHRPRKDSHTEFLSTSSKEVRSFDAPAPKRRRLANSALPKTAFTGSGESIEAQLRRRQRYGMAPPLELTLAMMQLRPVPAKSASPSAKAAAAPAAPPRSLKQCSTQPLAPPWLDTPPLRRPPVSGRRQRPPSEPQAAEWASFLPELGYHTQVCGTCGLARRTRTDIGGMSDL